MQMLQAVTKALMLHKLALSCCGEKDQVTSLSCVFEFSWACLSRAYDYGTNKVMPHTVQNSSEVTSVQTQSTVIDTVSCTLYQTLLIHIKLAAVYMQSNATQL